MNTKKGIIFKSISYILLTAFAAVFVSPILIVLMNSFKSRFYISDEPFEFPNELTFAGLTNYIEGIEKTGFLKSFGWSVFITVFSVAVIVLFTSMTAWYITRHKSRLSSVLYYPFFF